jgi:hypothetical protein
MGHTSPESSLANMTSAPAAAWPRLSLPAKTVPRVRADGPPADFRHGAQVQAREHENSRAERNGRASRVIERYA